MELQKLIIWSLLYFSILLMHLTSTYLDIFQKIHSVLRVKQNVVVYLISQDSLLIYWFRPKNKQTKNVRLFYCKFNFTHLLTNVHSFGASFSHFFLIFIILGFESFPLLPEYPADQRTFRPGMSFEVQGDQLYMAVICDFINKKRRTYIIHT